MPFDGSNFKRLVKQISAGDYYEPKKPSTASTLIRDMLTVCPKQRATIEQICNHWWVNESYQESCLDLAEELANQTPVRLDVLLSLAPTAVTSDQLVVPGPMEDGAQTVTRSHSVGSICDIANTEAERRIIDMVAAGGEAALAPSPTRNITPMENPAQAKRKLESTISTEAVIGGSIAGNRKRDRQDEAHSPKADLSISEVVEIGKSSTINLNDSPAAELNSNDNEGVIRDISSSTLPDVEYTNRPTDIIKTEGVGSPSSCIEEIETEGNVGGVIPQNKSATVVLPPRTERQNSLPDEEIQKNNSERRRSRIFETAGKFEGINNNTNVNAEKPKKIVIPGVSVGNFKKEFERKASLTSLPTPLPISSNEKRLLINSDSVEQADPLVSNRKNSIIPTNASADDKVTQDVSEIASAATASSATEVYSQPLAQSDSKSSTFSLEEARRSMENSIALLNQAKTESNSDVEQLCAKTESVAVSTNDSYERQKKLKNAREIIGNAIPVGKISTMGKLRALPGVDSIYAHPNSLTNIQIGVRKPPVPFGINGRSASGSVVPSSTPGIDRKPNFHVSTPPDTRLYERESPLSIHTAKRKLLQSIDKLTHPKLIVFFFF